MSYCTINIIQDKLHGSAQNDELIALYCSYWRHLMQKHQCVYILYSYKNVKTAVQDVVARQSGVRMRKSNSHA